MTAKNDITGDNIVSRASTDSYRDNYDRIFGKKARPVEPPVCALCNGTGSVDSGGTTPWGEAIFIGCYCQEFKKT